MFRVFRVPFDYPAHSLQETVLPETNGADGIETLKVCLLLVWMTRHLACIGAEKWSRDLVIIRKIENLHIATSPPHVEKFTDTKNAILFDL